MSTTFLSAAASRAADAQAEAHSGPTLYGRMMQAIASGHTFGNRVRMLKLPLIFTEEHLYAGAIAQFYLLTEALEEQLHVHHENPMVAKVRALGLCATPGYAADLKQLLGEDWRAEVEATTTLATARYIEDLKSASATSVVAAAFILYGALVVGGACVMALYS